MLSAETYIFIVGAEDDLFTDFGNSAFTVKPRVHDRFPSAPTNCFYLFNRVGKSHESVTALKKIALKISSQPIAYHRNIVFVNCLNKQHYLRSGQKLRFVNDYAVINMIMHIVPRNIIEQNAFVGQPAAGTHDACTVANINSRLRNRTKRLPAGIGSVPDG